VDGPRETDDPTRGSDDPELRLRDEMRVLQSDERLSFRSAMGRALAALARAGARDVLVMTEFWALDTNTSERVEYLTRLRAGISLACPHASIYTMFSDAGFRVPNNGKVLAAMRDDAAPVRILLLHDGEGDREQITVLDLAFIQAIISVGTLLNPQQAYSRALRASPSPR